MSERDELVSFLRRIGGSVCSAAAATIEADSTLRAERDEYRQEYLSKCGCEFEGDVNTVKCFVHKTIERQLSEARAQLASVSAELRVYVEAYHRPGCASMDGESRCTCEPLP